MAQDNQTHILQLPPELMWNIAQYLRLPEVGYFRETSKEVNEKVKPLFFRRLSEEYRDEGVYTILSKYTSFRELEEQEKKEFLKLLFGLMLANLKRYPAMVCRLVEMSHEMGLKPEDFHELGQAVVMAFRFLTHPIQIQDSTKVNRTMRSNCVSRLRQNGYSQTHCLDLQNSINTERFLQSRTEVFKGIHVYRNFAGADFRKANLEGVTLYGANLREANLSGANLSGVDLRSANFQNANLVGAILARADLGEANLSGANLQNAFLWETCLVRTKFVGANLSGVNFHGANLFSANFYRAKLEGADFRKANLEGVNFEGANLERADLREAKLEGANFEGAFLRDAVFFTNFTVADFIHKIEKSVKHNPAGILPLLLAISAKQLEMIDTLQVNKLKNLSRRCLLNVLTEIDSVEVLKELLAQIKNPNTIFSYSPLFRKGVENIYPEILTLIANTYFANKLTCDDERVEKEFKQKLIAEINKQKNPLGFHNDGWNELLERIRKTEPKGNSPSARPRMQPT